MPVLTHPHSIEIVIPALTCPILSILLDDMS
jgi:hypothetical protein